MAYNTCIQQGEYTADGTPKMISLRSDMDWVEVHNWTNLIAGTQWAGVKWYWQRGMLADDAITWFHAAASQVLSMSSCTTGYNGAVYHGVTALDSSEQTVSAAIATTAINGGAPPVVNTGNTANIVTNFSVVRLANTLGTLQFGGMDFTVGAIVANTSFTLLYAPTVIASVLAGEYRIVRYDPSFYPRRRTITAITAANPAVITMSVLHDFNVGEQVKIICPDDFAMTQINGLTGTITATAAGAGSANTISVDIDSTAFTAFAYPLTAGVPFTHAQVVPVGEDTAQALASGVTIFGDSTEDRDYIGFMLGTSSAAAIALGSAGGSNGDVIKWRAGKSFAVLNE